MSCIPSLRDGFIGHSLGDVDLSQRHRSDLPGSGTATVLFPGMSGSIPAYSVKVHAKFPTQDPAIRGVLLLFSIESGDLLAAMDSSYLTAVRTGLAAAMAADVLARSEAENVAVIGAGTQGRFQLQYLGSLREVKRVKVFDTSMENTARFVREMAEVVSCPIESTKSIDSVLEGTDIVLCATWATAPFLSADRARPGMHINSLGADEPGKAELDSELIRSAVCICDDRELATRMGAVGNAGLGRDSIDAELGEVLAGEHPGRQAQDDITVFASVGLPLQDVVVAWEIYQRALETGVGTRYDYLSRGST